MPLGEEVCQNAGRSRYRHRPPAPSTQEPSLVALPKHPETGLGQRVVQREQEALSEPTGDQMQLRPLQRSGPEQRRNGFSTTGESSQQRQSCGFQSAELEENLELSPSKALALQRGKSSRGTCSSCDWPVLCVTGFLLRTRTPDFFQPVSIAVSPKVQAEDPHVRAPEGCWF